MGNKDTITRSGILIFDPPDMSKKHIKQRVWKRVAMIVLNDDTSEFYQWLIEREFKLIQGKKCNTNWLLGSLRGSHVTIINDRIDDIKIWDMLREKYHNKEISFTYNVASGLRNNGKHIYYEVDCLMGDVIREEGNLGDPYYNLHLTIGRVNDDIPHKKEHIGNVREYMIRR